MLGRRAVSYSENPKIRGPQKCINTWDFTKEINIGGLSIGFLFIKQKKNCFGKMVIGLNINDGFFHTWHMHV